ncbi:enoyl-CoA hydratase/isomerase family protein [Alteromonas sediminis]|uniref:3-hydroxyisobutyryl-CoA hydrolase n=1 Tax=Alteromonas sediminis TaxID=2259342 RepID=A0A3N5Y2M0_9ALTE|nr:enoyl-CoA hydratase/isomerase family protein [Alteromonas sediminis]RPJ67550.1 enoyl-CoA hydratase/isomerase family protein [Alteromonas sediminis]
MAENAAILSAIKPGKAGKSIGTIVLNKPKALNALDHNMAESMLSLLEEWASDDNITCVCVYGAGDKAFCAGGDVVSMHKAMTAQPEQTPSSVEAFFTTEYRLDYLIHTYNKPIIVVGHGFVMGGGMGLFCGASHKVVTPSSRLAMPEITIGLFPDVGGTYFLPRLGRGMGLFLGLTGIPFNAADALFVGMADHHIADGNIDAVIDALLDIEWSADSEHGKQVTQVLEQFTVPATNPSKLAQYQHEIAALDKADSVIEVAAMLEGLNRDDKWINRAVGNFTKGSPITAHVVFEQIRRGAHLNLAEAFRLELNMACTCAALGEFQEGVRALLIDKDNSPNWRYKQLDEVPDDVIAKHFTPIWAGATHPLSHLEMKGTS